jgi:peroxiredoxin
MRQWGLQQGLTEDMSPSAIGTFEKVKLIPDGAAAFTKAMGMLVPWDTERGFGERSWRYSMVRIFLSQKVTMNEILFGSFFTLTNRYMRNLFFLLHLLGGE